MTPSPGSSATEPLEIRRAQDGDRAAIVDLCRRSLGWDDEGTDAAFFGWKHDENPAGPSPAWVAVTPSGDIAGVRLFLRWRFRHEGRSLLGVRAVDTATDPAWRGRGVFSRLTMGALPGLRRDGVDFVFNTPNDQSRPGYLKMGWQPVGRVPVGVLFRPGVARHIRSIRTPADRWGQATDVGVPVLEALALPETAALLDRLGARPGIATEISMDWLRWRYRFAPLGYCAVPLNGERVSDGLVVFRLRNRGPVLECTVCEVLALPGTKVHRSLSKLLARTGADMMLIAPGGASSGVIQAPLGPMLTWRPIGRPGTPKMRDLMLTMGDLELF